VAARIARRERASLRTRELDRAALRREKGLTVRSWPKQCVLIQRGMMRMCLCVPQKEANMQTQKITGGLAVTAMWEVRDGEADMVADILARFAPQARQEPGVKLFLVHRALENPSQFLFYELFEDTAAFEAHQQTPHFKALILGEGVPRLARRERTQYAML
jgi:quinol monooxygenase YgiN